MPYMPYKKDLKRDKVNFTGILPFPPHVVNAKPFLAKLFLEIKETIFTDIYGLFFKYRELELLGLTRGKHWPFFYQPDFYNLNKPLNKDEMHLLPRADLSKTKSLSFVNTNLTL